MQGKYSQVANEEKPKAAVSPTAFGGSKSELKLCFLPQ